MKIILWCIAIGCGIMACSNGFGEEAGRFLDAYSREIVNYVSQWTF